MKRFMRFSETAIPKATISRSLWGRFFLAGTVLITIAVLSVALISCQTKNDDFAEAPIITSATYQHTLYNGKPQPIDVQAAKPGALFSVTYFSSKDALEQNEGGVSEVPSGVGAYYARIERPAGNGYAVGRPIPVEYYIQKAFVTIQAEEKQEALYDGQPKRVSASAEPPVPLVITYYPVSMQNLNATSAEAPTGPGIYRVIISFVGDENYRPASKDVEFSIVK
jgi:hypothetical protein